MMLKEHNKNHEVLYFYFQSTLKWQKCWTVPQVATYKKNNNFHKFNFYKINT